MEMSWDVIIQSKKLTFAIKTDLHEPVHLDTSDI